MKIILWREREIEREINGEKDIYLNTPSLLPCEWIVLGISINSEVEDIDSWIDKSCVTKCSLAWHFCKCFLQISVCDKLKIYVCKRTCCYVGRERKTDRKTSLLPCERMVNLALPGISINCENGKIRKGVVSRV